MCSSGIHQYTTRTISAFESGKITSPSPSASFLFGVVSLPQYPDENKNRDPDDKQNAHDHDETELAILTLEVLRKFFGLGRVSEVNFWHDIAPGPRRRRTRQWSTLLGGGTATGPNVSTNTPMTTDKWNVGQIMETNLETLSSCSPAHSVLRCLVRLRLRVFLHRLHHLHVGQHLSDIDVHFLFDDLDFLHGAVYLVDIIRIVVFFAERGEITITLRVPRAGLLVAVFRDIQIVFSGCF